MYAALNVTVKSFGTFTDKMNHHVIQPEIRQNVRKDMIKATDGEWFSPSCGPFCFARDPNDGVPDIYGLPTLWPEEQEIARVDTTCFVRAAEAAQLRLDKCSVIGPEGKNIWIPWLCK